MGAGKEPSGRKPVPGSLCLVGVQLLCRVRHGLELSFRSELKGRAGKGRWMDTGQEGK